MDVCICMCLYLCCFSIFVLLFLFFDLVLLLLCFWFLFSAWQKRKNNFLSGQKNIQTDTKKNNKNGKKNIACFACFAFVLRLSPFSFFPDLCCFLLFSIFTIWFLIFHVFSFVFQVEKNLELALQENITAVPNTRSRPETCSNSLQWSISTSGYSDCSMRAHLQVNNCQNAKSGNVVIWNIFVSGSLA